MTEAEMKNILLEILQEVHAFCIEHNLRYSLAYGTLLGAIRHNGFIPWDDDIDIIMPRHDYDSFQKNFTSRHLKVISSHDKKYFYPYLKVYNTNTYLKENVNYAYPDLGVYIDIFPADSLDKNKYFRRLKYWVIYLLRKICVIKQVQLSHKRSGHKNFILSSLKILAAPIPMRAAVQAIVKLCPFHAADDSDECGVVLDQFRLISLQKKWFDALIKIPFEGKEFLAVPEPARYLSQTYGDYMQLPPASKQVSTHSHEAGWLNPAKKL